MRRALTDDPRASTAFNLALVLESANELVDARTLYDRLLAGDFGELPEDKRALASERRTRLTAGIATLRIGVRGAERADIAVDERARGTARAGEPVRVDLDPGEHTVRARTEDGLEEMADVSLGRGEVRSMTLAFAPDGAADGRGQGRGDGERGPSDGVLDPATGARTDEAAPSNDGVFIAIGVGLGALAVGGVILAVVLATQAPGVPEGFLGEATALTASPAAVRF